jgi:cellulose synthase/poly-beta-1,6-N-acetylglucosamine synthase-like glycosyltransferase
LRPLGRSALGLSVGLKGNGMCFSRRVIERFGWGSYSLAEDAEHHLALVAANVRVRYMPEAIVTSAMPTSLRQARSQQQRWERGRLVLARAYAGPLLRGARRERDLAQLDAIAEVCLPPLSVLAGALALVSALALALRWTPGLVIAAVLVGVLALHGVAGMALARLTPRAYLSLAYAPIYVLWKIGVYLRAAAQKGATVWVRTPRVAAAPAEPSTPGTDR